MIATEDGYRMYYTGGTNPERMHIRDPDNEGSGAMYGMATSEDGINWAKYNDPSTAEAPYAESDPVLEPSSSGWDAMDVKCSVMKTETGWEMLYKALRLVSYSVPSRYGYAISEDGVSWDKYPGNPIFQSNDDPLAYERDSISAPSALKVGSTYYLYYSYWRQAMEGVATGVITEP